METYAAYASGIPNSEVRKAPHTQIPFFFIACYTALQASGWGQKGTHIFHPVAFQNHIVPLLTLLFLLKKIHNQRPFFSFLNRYRTESHLFIDNTFRTGSVH